MADREQCAEAFGDALRQLCAVAHGQNLGAGLTTAESASVILALLVYECAWLADRCQLPEDTLRSAVEDGIKCIRESKGPVASA